MTKSKMITLYGINRIGKTTQSKLLVDFFLTRGKKASHMKYPVYDFEPDGPFIYKYLRDPRFRHKHKLTTEELQKKYVKNRRDNEPALKKRLDAGEWVIVEDYVGTGIAWGLTWGADLEYLEKINEDLFQADLSILLHGNSFDLSLEAGHRNETSDEKMKICKNFHWLLGERYGWKKVNANQSIEAVARDINTIVESFFVDDINQ